VDRTEKVLFYLLILSFVGAYFSITVYQGFLLLSLLLGVYLAFKRTFRGGIFTVPLLGHLAVIDLSSALFLRVPEQWRRLLEQNIFSLTYFLAFLLREGTVKKLTEWIIKLSIPLGVIVSLKVLYSYWFEHNIKAFWGGNFIIGNLLALPFFASLYYIFHSQRWIFRFTFLFLAVFFLAVSFLAVERSVILGFLIGLTIFGIAIFKQLKGRKWKLTFLGSLLALITTGGFVAIKNPKVEYWFHLITTKGINEQTLNSISSGRVVIAKGAFELVDKAVKEGDYLKLLIGWGYGPQKQYKNLPPSWQFINEYESFILLTEFINGGLLGVLFIIWFYIAAIILTVRSLKNQNHFWWKVILLSSVWVNLGYHLFTLFWVPINATYYLLLGLIERLNQRVEGKNSA